MEQFKQISGTLFGDTKSHPPEIVWALKRYVETTQMQSFVNSNTIFSITSITEGNHSGDPEKEQDLYFVSFSCFGGGALMGSRVAVHKNSIVDLVREYKLKQIL
jgi:hypothetical protein